MIKMEKEILIILTPEQIEEIKNILDYRNETPDRIMEVVETLIKLGLDYYREIEPSYLKFLADRKAKEVLQ